MFGMDAWDAVLVAAGGYLAVITLVRLMQRRRDAIIEDLSREVELAKERTKRERKLKRRREAREKMQQHQRKQFEARKRESA